jgi:hypothetical protein
MVMYCLILPEISSQTNIFFRFTPGIHLQTRRKFIAWEVLCLQVRGIAEQREK